MGECPARLTTESSTTGRSSFDFGALRLRLFRRLNATTGGNCTARTLRVAHWSPRRIPHTLPALLAPLPALPLRHRTPCDARQGRRLRLAAPARLLEPPVTWKHYRAWSHRSGSTVLGETPSLPCAAGRF